MKLNLDTTPTLRSEIIAAISAVYDSECYIRGPAYAKFCAEFALACACSDCVGLGSGTDALALTLRALGIGEGDEVITPAFNVAYTAQAVASVGATPIFADVDFATLTLSPAAVAAALTPRTAALIPVHIFGHMADMPALTQVLHDADRLDVTIIEDACQAMGAALDGLQAGAWGHAAAFSFYPTKNLGALGDGGAVVSNDSALCERVSQLADAGRCDRYTHTLLGANSRLDDIQAAVLTVRLRHLDAALAKRRAQAQHYAAHLSDHVTLPIELQDYTHAFHLYAIRHPRRDALLAHLNAAGVPSLVHYPIAAHLQPCFRDLGGARDEHPIAEAAAASVLSLPLHPSLARVDQNRVIELVNAFD